MRISRYAAPALAILLIAGLSPGLAGCGRGETQIGDQTGNTVRRGGRLLASSRGTLASFNRFVHASANTEMVNRLTQGRLIRLNRATRDVEPAIAREWAASPDGLIWTFTIHDDAKFSDGTPVTSADVVFTFEVLFDPKVDSPIASSLTVNGKPMTARAVDARTVVVTFPAPFGPSVSVLDVLPILPSHRLRAALAAGTFRDAWGLATPPADLVGAGPFVVREHVAGERLVLARNPHYWKRDDSGQALPYLDEIEIQFVADQNTEMIRLEAGALDLSTDQIRPEDIRQFRELARQGRVRLVTPGVTMAPDFLWFNLVPGAPAAKDRPWLQTEAFRKAISHAVDRQAVVNTVYLGAAQPIFGPVTPGQGDWFLKDLPRTDHDPVRARALLASIGLTDRTGDGVLDDAAGKPARFSVLTHKGHAGRERTMTVVQEQLRQVGLELDVVAIDPSSIQKRVGKGDYDGAYFYIIFDSFDPSRSPDYWLSSGHFHLWHPGQKQPATPWEAAIDRDMHRVTGVIDPAERRRLFAGVQKTMAEHMPAIYLVAPEIVVAMHARVRGETPSVLQMPILWNAERLWLASDRAPAR